MPLHKVDLVNSARHKPYNYAIANSSKITSTV